MAYTKLYIEKYGEEPRENAVYPSILFMEVVYKKGKWINISDIKVYGIH